jgi:hypothetical protein
MGSNLGPLTNWKVSIQMVRTSAIDEDRDLEGVSRLAAEDNGREGEVRGRLLTLD